MAETGFFLLGAACTPTRNRRTSRAVRQILEALFIDNSPRKRIYEHSIYHFVSPKRDDVKSSWTEKGGEKRARGRQREALGASKNRNLVTDLPPGGREHRGWQKIDRAKKRVSLVMLIFLNILCKVP